MRALTLLLLALFVLAPMPGRAARSYDTCTAFVSTVPAVIASPGTYCLNANLVTSMASGAAIAINASNVTLDCDDFRVDDLGAGAATTAIGISASNQNYVTIRHCNVGGFQQGIVLADNGSGKGANLIEDNHLDGNTNVGISSQGTRSIVRRNIVLDTGTTTQHANAIDGIVVDGDSQVVDNVVSGVTSHGASFGVYGIHFSNVEAGGTVNRNRVSNVVPAAGDASYGIFLGGTSAVARDNSIFGVPQVNNTAIDCSGSHDIVQGTIAGGFKINNLGQCGNGGGNNFHP